MDQETARIILYDKQYDEYRKEFDKILEKAKYHSFFCWACFIVNIFLLLLNLMLFSPKLN